jgi:hypothetical protein
MKRFLLVLPIMGLLMPMAGAKAQVGVVGSFDAVTLSSGYFGNTFGSVITVMLNWYPNKKYSYPNFKG